MSFPTFDGPSVKNPTPVERKRPRQELQQQKWYATVQAYKAKPNNERQNNRPLSFSLSYSQPSIPR
ncbi:hypothetical protein COLO4_30873 [Corchorus olitorius]|uniref:Uncharacterized protein n=1 Tax=Corchorus olitorius TaxID=93759 RepID=A0A1R3H6X5_9ROSI|nr:hypothetical protein COLO4_30873 [Corchorus olitorius]